MPTAGTGAGAGPKRTAPKQAKAMVAAMLDHQAAQVEQMTQHELRALYPVLLNARRDLAKELQALVADRNTSATYTTQEKRNALLMVNAALTRMSKKGGSIGKLKESLDDVLKSVGGQAMGMSAKHLNEQLATFGALFEGTIHPISLREAAIVAEASKALIPQYRTSAARYAGDVGADIRARIADGFARNETFDQMIAALVKHGGPKGMVALRGVAGEPGAKVELIAEGLFKRYEYWAERLVRTEGINAYNVVHQRGIDELAEEDDEYLKRWDATADRRKCEWCQRLDEKLIKPGDDFVSPLFGRKKHPPAHPYCRCTVIPWKLEWDGGLVVAPTAVVDDPVAPVPTEAKPATKSKAAPKPKKSKAATATGIADARAQNEIAKARKLGPVPVKIDHEAEARAAAEKAAEEAAKAKAAAEALAAAEAKAAEAKAAAERAAAAKAKAEEDAKAAAHKAKQEAAVVEMMTAMANARVAGVRVKLEAGGSDLTTLMLDALNAKDDADDAFFAAKKTGNEALINEAIATKQAAQKLYTDVQKAKLKQQNEAEEAAANKAKAELEAKAAAEKARELAELEAVRAKAAAEVAKEPKKRATRAKPGEWNAKMLAPTKGAPGTTPLGIHGKAIPSDGDKIEGGYVHVRLAEDEHGKFYEFQYKVTAHHAESVRGALKNEGATESRWLYDRRALNSEGILSTRAVEPGTPGKDVGAAISLDTQHRGIGVQVDMGYAQRRPDESNAQAIGNAIRFRARATTPEEALAVFAEHTKSIGIEDATKTPKATDVKRQAKARILAKYNPQQYVKLLRSQSEGELDELYEKVHQTSAPAMAKMKESTLATVEERSSYPGHHGLFSKAQADLMRKEGKILGMTHDGSCPPDIALNIVLDNGLMSSRRRFDCGVFTEGMSTGTDFSTGGADGVFLRVQKDAAELNRAGGRFRFLVDTEETGRLDWWAYSSDQFGIAGEASFNGRWPVKQIIDTPRPALDNELMFPGGVAKERIYGLRCRTVADREEVLAGMRQRGIKEIRGVPIEEFVR